MATVSVTAGPYSADNPSFIIDWDEVYGDGLQLECAANQILANFPAEFRSVATYCGPGDEKPVTGTRSFQVTAWLSYGDGVSSNPVGLYTILAAKAGKLVKFAALPDHSAAVSPTNPETSGQVWVPPIPPFSAGAPEDPVTIPLELKIYQQLATTDDPLAAVMNHPLGPAI